MRKINIWILLFMLLTIYACQKPMAPVFRKIDDVKIVDSDNQSIILEGTSYFYNPNKNKITLKSAGITVALDEKPVTEIKKDFNLSIPPESDFSVPLQVQLNKEQVQSYLKGSALKFILGKKIRFHYYGYIKVKSYGLVIRVPVDDVQELSLDDLF